MLQHLHKVKKSGTGWSAICPAHEDSTPSLSVSEGKDGKVVLHCHRGCTVEEVVKAAGLEMKDLWPPDDTPKQQQKKQWVANYDYTDQEGNLLFQVTRWVYPDGKKTFTQRRPLPHGGWEYHTSGMKKPLYRLPNILQAISNGDIIYIAEGEKDVHTLEQQGVTATCNPGGAGSWQPHHTQTLKNAKQAVIIADNDTVGLRHATNITQALKDLGIDARTVTPPQPHKDITDLIEAGGTLNQLEPVTEETNTDPFVEIVTQIRDLSTKQWPTHRKLDRARSILDSANYITDQPEIQNWPQLLKGPIEPYDWIIPNLLERQERVIVVAAEGVGKTMLARQIALMTAAGLHPFTATNIPPLRTLYIDLENPERIIKRTSHKILEHINWFKPNQTIHADILIKPDGINLLNPKDRTYLEQAIQQSQPDITFLGPLYKAYLDPGTTTTESTITNIAQYLDYLRTTHNTALWLEHHAPFGTSQTNRQLRPFGSTVWSRWPEFGINLTPDPTTQHRYELNHYRGARDQREWPKALKRGQTWPFEPEY